MTYNTELTVEPESLEQMSANEILTLREALKNLLDVFERCEAGYPPEIEIRFLVIDLAKAALEPNTNPTE